MVRNQSAVWLTFLGLLSACPFAAIGQTGIVQPRNLTTAAISSRLSDRPMMLRPICYQEASPSQNTQASQEPKSANESPLSEALSVTDLRGGIEQGSMQRAIGKREIADPNMAFMSTAGPAEFSFTFDCQPIWKTWESPNVRYRPLYFEEENLERYGNHTGHFLQPYKSGVFFLSRVVTLPYQMAAQGTEDCEYGLGYFRPGNCNPAYRQRIERSAGGFIVQSLTVGAILGL